MLKIGLTGGIGSGKTAVSQFFSEFGVPIIDSDLIAHELTKKNSPLAKKITDHFGAAVVQNGELNRAALSKIIFSNPEEKMWLEQILHPPIIQKMIETTEKLNTPYCIFVIPLLIEGNFKSLVDRILVVDVPIELQIQRVKERNRKTDAEIQAIIKSQSSREEKLAAANDIIENVGSLAELKSAVSLLHQNYLDLASKPH